VERRLVRHHIVCTLEDIDLTLARRCTSEW
jgi:hypothetical protein